MLADYVDRHRDRIVDTLFDYLRIPSISAAPEHAVDVRRSAEFTAGMLADAGMTEIEILETVGLPSVTGAWRGAGPTAPTVVVYGHHDVQPVDPESDWTSPPFQPVIVDGECRARGAVDDKGQVLYEIEAARGLLETQGALPVNLVFLVEGEEEIGSPNFESLLERERERLRCDAVVVSDTGMWSATVPSFCTGMRGLALTDLIVRTATIDLHSGSYGGAVANAAHVLARVIAALHDADGRITIPGFYDAVRPLTERESDSFDALGLDDEQFRSEAGAFTIMGEAGRSTLERIWSRPTAEIVGMTSGWGPGGVRTIVPSEARARLTFRLVADQQPEAVLDAAEAWVQSQLPPGVQLETHRPGSVAPALTPIDHPAVGALSRAIERVWGVPPLPTREGGSGPEEALGRVLDAPVLFLGVGLPGDRIHAPNERMVMDQFWKGLLAAGELWREMGALGRG